MRIHCEFNPCSCWAAILVIAWLISVELSATTLLCPDTTIVSNEFDAAGSQCAGKP